MSTRSSIHITTATGYGSGIRRPPIFNNLLNIVDSDKNPMPALVQYGQFLGEFPLVDGGGRHRPAAMHGLFLVD